MNIGFEDLQSNGFTKVPQIKFRGIGPNIVFKSRYIAHTEDEPFFKSGRWDRIGDATQAVFDQVQHRLDINGCGDGAVLDLLTGEIVVVIGHVQGLQIGAISRPLAGTIPLPCRTDIQRLKGVILDADQWTPGSKPMPFFWNTWAG